eukprot:TRINITY_DN9947_c0_g1_i3.p1 TRINITY_DN9947_c0_g1~~TRINITY_DN9947_c0_g1_i3.p1  ORF type:complete len:163 (-),score=10.86 TRINITY_DN9947_c0_g1_i3:107-595(-)
MQELSDRIEQGLSVSASSKLLIFVEMSYLYQHDHQIILESPIKQKLSDYSFSIIPYIDYYDLIDYITSIGEAKQDIKLFEDINHRILHELDRSFIQTKETLFDILGVKTLNQRSRLEREIIFNHSSLTHIEARDLQDYSTAKSFNLSPLDAFIETTNFDIGL